MQQGTLGSTSGGEAETFSCQKPYVGAPTFSLPVLATKEYFLRCTGELGAHVMSDNILREVPIEVVVAFVCFLVKRDNAFHDLLVDNSLEPDTNAFMTSIL